jgi:phage/plasmid-associated DNA primase
VHRACRRLQRKIVDEFALADGLALGVLRASFLPTEYRTENNPARMFLLETCREAPDGRAPCSELYQAYQLWCKGNGYLPLASQSFGKEVKRVFPKMERRDVQSKGCRMYVYVGLAHPALAQAEAMRNHDFASKRK